MASGKSGSGAVIEPSYPGRVPACAHLASSRGSARMSLRNEGYSRHGIPAPREICHSVRASRDSFQSQRLRARTCLSSTTTRRELDMRIAIMGSGAVGGYFGARLAAGGSEVTFIARGAHLAAMRENGLIVESPLGEIKLPRVEASDDPRAIGAVDLVIVAVKRWDTESA